MVQSGYHSHSSGLGSLQSYKHTCTLVHDHPEGRINLDVTALIIQHLGAAGEFGTQSHPWLHSKSETSLKLTTRGFVWKHPYLCACCSALLHAYRAIRTRHLTPPSGLVPLKRPELFWTMNRFFFCWLNNTVPPGMYFCFTHLFQKYPSLKP